MTPIRLYLTRVTELRKLMARYDKATSTQRVALDREIKHLGKLVDETGLVVKAVIDAEQLGMF